MDFVPGLTDPPVTRDAGAGLTALCPDCTAQITETVARQSRPYRTSQRGGGRHE